MMLLGSPVYVAPLPPADTVFPHYITARHDPLERRRTASESIASPISRGHLMSNNLRHPAMTQVKATDQKATATMLSSELAKDIELSPIDDAQPRGYVRTILSFAHCEDKSRVLEALNRGVTAVVSRWPRMRGRVIPNEAPNSRGRVVILSSDRELKVLEKHLTYEEFPFTHEEFNQSMAPIRILDEQILCGQLEPAIPGDVMVVQSNFLATRGLLLSICLHHSVVDGEGTRLVIEEFARGCCSPETIINNPCMNLRQEQSKLRPSAIRPLRHPIYMGHDEEGLHRRSPSLETLSDSDSESVSSSPLEDPALDNSPLQFATGHGREKTNLLLTFSATKLKELRASIAQSLGDSDVDIALVKRLSTNDCLAALLWNSITRARGPDLTVQKSAFVMAIDGRTKVKPAIDPGYIGAAVVHSSVSLDVEAVQASSTPSTIGRLATSIRHSLQTVDHEYIAQTVSFIKSLPDMCNFKLRVDRSADLLMTTWEKFGYQDMNFGTELGHPVWARKPYSTQVADIVVLPKSRHSDLIEVVLLLTRAQVARLLSDAEFMAFVEHHSS